MIRAGLYGIKHQLTPPEPVELNIFNMSEAERLEHHLELLPASLQAAVKEMAESDLVREALGDHIFERYLEAKRQEWEDYRIQVTDWEIQRYLGKY